MIRSFVHFNFCVALFAGTACTGAGYGGDGEPYDPPAAGTASVTMADPILDLSTVIDIDEIVSVGPGFLVVHEDDAGEIGEGIGRTPVRDGVNADVRVELSREVVDGETLYAMLHVDAGEIGVFEYPGPDEPVSDAEGALIAPPFTPSVDADVPAVRIVLSSIGATGYVVDAVEPAVMAEGLVGEEEDDPALTFRAGWRYEIVNTVTAGHPFELTTDGTDPLRDVVQLSQASDGALEPDATIAWTEEGDAVRFTVSDSFTEAVNGYRCSHHPGSMRGAIAVN